MEKMIITDVSEIEKVVESVLEVVQSKDGGRATVLALHGDLGAGKTTFTQTLAKKIGVTEAVTSPTFVVMKSYNLKNKSFEKLIHIDAYRIEDIDEMRVLGFGKLLEEKGSIISIEWAENIKELLPEHTMHICFELDGEKRIITIEHGN